MSGSPSAWAERILSVLTAIVIGFALTVILVALALRAWGSHRTLSTDKMRSAQALGGPLTPEPHDDR